MTTTYETTTDAAAEIRQTLKTKHGWTSRDVSVRSDYYSMGSSIRVLIKNPNVPLATVKAIAEGKEQIDRDQFGDILSGGNRFVDVHYTREVADILATKHMADVLRASQELKTAPENYLIPIANTPYLLGRGRFGNGLAVWDETCHRGECMDEVAVATWIGIGGHHN